MNGLTDRTDSVYQTKWLLPSQLGAEARAEMFSLYRQCYEGISARSFENDLAKKNEVLLLTQSGKLIGFTTLMWYDVDWKDAVHRVIFSGDTVVDPAHWGQQALAFRWLTRIGQLKRLDPARRIFWFLIVKGHRTYRYLPVFARTFIPHWKESHVPHRDFLRHVAQRQFGEFYNEETGLIEFPESRGHLRKELAHPSSRELQIPAVRFFLKRNPKYLNGHELACFCELSRENLKPMARRLFDKGFYESLGAS